MTLIFLLLGIVSFVAIGIRFATRITTREPVTSRVK